jgi:hypothetical protein
MFYYKQLITTFYYSASLIIVLFGYSTFSSLDQDTEDFLYLANVVQMATNGKDSKIEQVKSLTKWLSANVIKTTEYPGWERSGYPDWFDGSSVASVIKGGIGNCGFQANNIIVLSRYLGIEEHRRYWVGKKSGSEYEHAFSELIIDGKPGVFDPNELGFQEDENGEVLSLKELVQNPSVIKNSFFKMIATEIKQNPSVLRVTNTPQTPEPLGKQSFIIYSSLGSTITKMYLHLKNSPLSIFFLAWVIFVVVTSIREALIKYPEK